MKSSPPNHNLRGLRLVAAPKARRYSVETRDAKRGSSARSAPSGLAVSCLDSPHGSGEGTSLAIERDCEHEREHEPALEPALEPELALLRSVLDRFLSEADRVQHLAQDPLALVHEYEDPHDQEVAALLVAMLAYGRVASIRARAKAALGALGPRPAVGLARGRWRRLSGFVYRFQSGEDLPRFLRAVGRVRSAWGSLAGAFVHGVSKEHTDFVPAMSAFSEALRAEVRGSPDDSYGLRFLFPSPALGGAAKRLALFLRWMVRPADGVDLGTWARLGVDIAPARLLMPLDTHVHRIASYVGLCGRKAADLKAAREITENLRRLRPEDPLAYDLPLCHLGISGACPRRRVPSVCEHCGIRRLCRLGELPVS
ncbi:MAG: TIGR02757 family protein [Deltaproteobacteria bacterium]|nr:TIGR02757 family protein [Deltaproteobacteria bacterium]